MNKPRLNVDALIDSVANKKPGQRCRTCEDQQVAEIVLRLMERKERGEELPSIYTIHRSLIMNVSSVSLCSIKGHIQRCLRRDAKTGKRL